jgi:hypothetical protein
MKDPTITRFLDRLGAALGEGGFQIIDHREGSPFATGVAAPAEPRRLVYVSSYRMPEGRYYYDCEVPLGAEEDDFEVVETGVDVSYEEVEAAIRRHLGAG